jgi:hypothetical protein
MNNNNLFDKVFISMKVLRHRVVSMDDIYEESIINNTFNEDY